MRGFRGSGAAPVHPSYWPGAPRPSQNDTNWPSCGSDAVADVQQVRPGQRHKPRVPGRRARITASPVAASAGVNGGATALAN